MAQRAHQRWWLESGLIETHVARNSPPAYWESHKIHDLLAKAGAPHVDQIYRMVFEEILKEKISDRPVQVFDWMSEGTHELTEAPEALGVKFYLAIPRAKPGE